MIHHCKECCEPPSLTWRTSLVYFRDSLSLRAGCFQPYERAHIQSFWTLIAIPISYLWVIIINAYTSMAFTISFQRSNCTQNKNHALTVNSFRKICGYIMRILWRQMQFEILTTIITISYKMIRDWRLRLAYHIILHYYVFAFCSVAFCLLSYCTLCNYSPKIDHGEAND